MLGYLFGAGKFESVQRRVWMADVIAIVLTTVVSTTIYLNADAVFGLFTTDPLVLDMGKQVLLVEIFLGVGRTLNIVMVRALIAVGDVRTPVSVNVVSSWIFAVGGGYVLGVILEWGIVGMWIAMCVDEWIRAAFLLITFARGGWKRRAIAAQEDARECMSTTFETPVPLADNEGQPAGVHSSRALENTALIKTGRGVKEGEFVGPSAGSIIALASTDATDVDLGLGGLFQ